MFSSHVRSHSCQCPPSEFVPGWLAKWGMVTCFTSDVSSPDIVELERYQIPKRNLSLKERGLWVLGSLGVMVSIALIMSALFSGSEPNQETLVTVQDRIPVLSFILFLLNASVVEEAFYREVLWGVLSQPVVQVLLTSSLFALAHHPSSLFTWVLYGSLGLTLGVVRRQTDCLTSTLIHLSWNGIVFFLSLL